MSSVECNTCSRLREVRESQACLLPGWVSDGEASSLFSTLTHLPVLLALTLGWVGLFLLSVASFISAMHSWNTSKVTPTIFSNYVMNEQQHAVVVVCSVLPASALVYITIQIQANLQQDQIRTWIAVLHVDFKLLEIPAGVHRQSPDTIMLVNRGQNNAWKPELRLTVTQTHTVGHQCTVGIFFLFFLTLASVQFWHPIPSLLCFLLCFYWTNI